MYKIIDDYCFRSKNLYNYANYIIRQEYIKTQKYLPYESLWKILKDTEAFKDIGSNSGQHTLKLLHQNWKSFFAILKDYFKKPSKYLGRPHIPRYLPKNGRYVWILTNVQSKIINGYLTFSFKPLHPYNGIFRTKVNGKHLQTRFIPKNDHYVLEIVFQKEIPESKQDNNRIIGIDLGLDRFATVQNNIGLRSFSINGKGIKSINTFYHKETAKYRSKAKTVNNLEWTKRLQRIANKRNNKVENFMHHASKFIQNYCNENKIDTVILGYNKNWKQKLNMGKTGQSFTSIPYENFVSKLEYKLSDIGVKLIKTEESYTSGCSFLDGEIPCKENYDKSRRIKRGLFKSDTGQLIHADVNAASNIISKVFPNAFADGIKGVDLHPVIINVITNGVSKSQ